MRIVDFHAYPNRSELRSEVVSAFEDLDLEEGRRTDPIDDAAALGVGFDGDLTDDELRDLARDVREQLEGLVSEDCEVRFELADGDAEVSGGSPDHLE